MALWLPLGVLGVITSAIAWLRYIRRPQSPNERNRTRAPIFPMAASAITLAILVAAGLEATKRLSFDQRITSVGGSVSLIAALACWALWSRPKNQESQRFLLLAIFTSALTLLLVVMLWLTFANPPVNRAELLKTGGLASGALIAVYALWLNDRRRRVEESRQVTEENRRITEQKRQELEYDRAEHDRERVANEHFTRAVELLGHDADQVRVGAFHALVRLAMTRPEFGQTVADILCSYLRQPLPLAEHDNDAPLDNEKDRARSREVSVRAIVERLIGDLVSKSPTKEMQLDLNLTGAELHIIAIANGNIGFLTVANSTVNGSFGLINTTVNEYTIFKDSYFNGDVYIYQCHLKGNFLATETEFRRGLTLRESHFDKQLHTANIYTNPGVRIIKTNFGGKVTLDLKNKGALVDVADSYLALDETPEISISQGYTAEFDSTTGKIKVSKEGRS